jgi:hypothetical protein
MAIAQHLPPIPVSSMCSSRSNLRSFILFLGIARGLVMHCHTCHSMLSKGASGALVEGIGLVISSLTWYLVINTWLSLLEVLHD